MRVLVVEDDQTIAEFVAGGLREAGFAVDEAQDGELASSWRSRSYDAAIVDRDAAEARRPEPHRGAAARGGVTTPVLILSAQAVR